MAVATTLLGALTAQFNTSGTLSGLVPSGLWVAPVPEQSAGGPALPYVALIHQGEKPTYTFERQYIEEGNVTLACIAVGVAGAEAIATAVKAAFDQVVLPIAGSAQGVSCRRVDYRVEAELGTRGPDGDQVYRAAVSYFTRVVNTY